MMNKKDIEQILSAQLDVLYNTAVGIRKNASGKDVHAFRVAFKKLRAFARLLSFHSTGKDLTQLLRAIKKMYREAGKVRDKQLQYKRMRKAVKTGLTRPKAFLEHVKTDLKAGKKELVNSFHPKTIKKTGTSLKKHLPPALPDKYIVEFINSNFSSILNCINKPIVEDDDIHSIRKHLKDLTYTLKEIRIEDRLHQLKMPLTTSYLEQLESLSQETGDFMDAGFALLIFRQKNLEGLSDTEKKKVALTKEKWLGQKEKVRKEVIKSLGAFLPSLPTAAQHP